MVWAGPVAFASCISLLAPGCSTALAACSVTAILPPAYLACVTGAIGFGGSIAVLTCTPALLAPTP